MPQHRLQSAPLRIILTVALNAVFLCFSLSTLIAQSAPAPASIPSSDRISSPILRNITPNATVEYLVRLVNGDIITGKIVEILSSEAIAKELQKKTAKTANQEAERAVEGEAIRLETALGTLTIFAAEIVELLPRKQFYRHNHRLYIMPTAEPISGNAVIGLWELLFAYAGVGITDYVSVTAGRSLVPGILPSEQATLVNLKVTPYVTELDESGSRFFTCIGGNVALINEGNIFGHVYAGATFKGVRTSITGQIFFKANEPNTYTIRGGNLFSFSTTYPQGTFGLGLGLDSRLSDHHDLHFIGELWNADILRPSNSALLVGLRLCNTSISMDFGVAIVPQPLAVPFVSFAWTPF
jgi:hypothetical protein